MTSKKWIKPNLCEWRFFGLFYFLTYMPLSLSCELKMAAMLDRNIHLFSDFLFFLEFCMDIRSSLFAPQLLSHLLAQAAVSWCSWGGTLAFALRGEYPIFRHISKENSQESGFLSTAGATGNGIERILRLHTVHGSKSWSRDHCGTLTLKAGPPNHTAAFALLQIFCDILMSVCKNCCSCSLFIFQ